VGRKNHYGSKSPRGTEVIAATRYTRTYSPDRTPHAPMMAADPWLGRASFRRVAERARQRRESRAG
jgi:hypothetical protein